MKLNQGFRHTLQVAARKAFRIHLSDRTGGGPAQELGSYLAERPSLVGTVLIVDCRRGLLELDYALIKWVGHRQLPVHILLSKADKFNRQEQVLALRSTQKALDPYRVNGHEITVQLWSALKKIGMTELETQLSNWVRPPAPTSETPAIEPPTS